MKTHLNELKGRNADRKHPSTWDDIAAATGIRKATLISIGKGNARTLRPEYIDALCTYFGVAVDQLITADSVKLPLQLDIRPDRQGKQVGDR